MSRGKNRYKLRKKARKNLNILLINQKDKCFYCNRLIVSPKHPPLNIVAENDRCWVCKDEKIVWKATVDHRCSLANGGSNNISNLAAACWDCNADKDRSPRKRHRICEKCGCRKRNNTSKKCAICSSGICLEILCLSNQPLICNKGFSGFKCRDLRNLLRKLNAI